MNYKVTYYKGINIEEATVKAENFNIDLAGNSLVVTFRAGVGDHIHVFSHVVSVEKTD